MVIGKLRSEVFFKVNIPVALGAGYEDQLFDYGSVRGYLKPMGGGRNLVTGEIETTNSYELYIRYQPYYARVDLKIVIESRVFTIHTVVIMDEGKKQFLKYNISEKKDA